MAKQQTIHNIALFFILFTCQMLSAEARHMKSHSVKKSGQSKTSKIDVPRIVKHQITDECPCAAKLACPPDAHGTNPCHRRYPGHGPCPPCPSPPSLENPTMSSVVAASTDDIHHTSPGRSPGAGHAEEDSSNPTLRASAVAYQTEFRPTAPGSSPGGGHSDTSKDKTQQCSNEDSVKDFRPTAPGDSPGAGHSFTNSIDDFRPTAPGDSPGAGHASSEPGVKHPHAAERTIDDYRPTAPGHSPGGGHAISVQKIKSNN